MAIIHGDTVKFYTNTSAGATAVYTAVGCESSITLSSSRETIDTTGKCSSNWKDHITGDGSYTLSGDGFADAGDAGLDRMINDHMAGTQILWQMKTFNSQVYAGTGTINQFDLVSSHGDAVKYSFNITGDGAYTET